MQNMFSRIKSPALRQGLLYGLILGFVELALGFFIAGLPALIISYGLYLLVTLFVGQRVSQQTGSLKAGVLGGFWTGLFSALVSVIFSLFFLFTQTDQIVSALQSSAKQAGQPTNIYTPDSVIQSELIVILIGVAIVVLLGLAGGAIGGFMGKNRAVPPKGPYEEPVLEPPSPTTQN